MNPTPDKFSGHLSLKNIFHLIQYNWTDLEEGWNEARRKDFFREHRRNSEQVRIEKKEQRLLRTKSLVKQIRLISIGNMFQTECCIAINEKLIDFQLTPKHGSSDGRAGDCRSNGSAVQIQRRFIIENWK